MKRRCWSLFLIAFGLQGATTATFDDLPEPFEFALPSFDTYQELRWKGVLPVNTTHALFDRYPRCGYRVGRVSGDYVAVVANRHGESGEITAADGSLFDLLSVFLTAGWRNDLEVRISGFRKGVQQNEYTQVVGIARPAQVVLNFRSVDTVRISSSGGASAGICDEGCTEGPEVVLDDLVYVVHRPCALASGYTVQTGAFRSLDNAETARNRLPAGLEQVHIYRQNELYLVAAGCTADAPTAEALQTSLRAGGIEGIVVPLESLDRTAR